MCLADLNWVTPKHWDGVTVYRLARPQRGVKPRAWSTLYQDAPTIRLGQEQQRQYPRSARADSGQDYPVGVHCVLTRDAARAYKKWQGLHEDRTTTLKGRITGEIVAKGTQGGVPVVVVTSVIWEKVVR